MQGSGFAFFAPADEEDLLADLYEQTVRLTIESPGPLLLLVRRRTPPRLHARDDGDVRTFGVHCNLLPIVLKLAKTSASTGLVFTVVEEVLSGKLQVSGIKVFQQGDSLASERAASSKKISWIIPHKGNIDALKVCLTHLSATSQFHCCEVLVGFDEAITQKHENLMAAFPQVRFWSTSSPGRGPYALRNAMIKVASGEILAFQDSDDVPTLDRLDCQVRNLNFTADGLVGGHEIRVDRLLRRVSAVRYPLDATSALKQCPGHVQLFPCSIVSRRSFERAGGLGTNLAHSLDTQFQLRAFFSERLINVDAFIYVKTAHNDSLKRDRIAGLDSYVRAKLWAEWQRHFSDVRMSSLSLDNSRLAPLHSAASNLVALTDEPSSLCPTLRAPIKNDGRSTATWCSAFRAGRECETT
jgi:Glycosyl transferase family 2